MKSIGPTATAAAGFEVTGESTASLPTEIRRPHPFGLLSSGCDWGGFTFKTEGEKHMELHSNGLVGKHKRHPSNVIAFCIILVGLLTFIGCVGEQRKQAQDLVKDGSTASDRLAKYYDTLAQQRSDHLALTMFELHRTGSPLQPELKAAYKDQQQALAARAEMARKLKNIYDSLGKLIDYDAPAEITGAVNDLKDAIEKVADKKLSLPGITGVDPKTILDKAVKAFAEWYQIRQFRKNAPKAQVILDSIYQLYDAEKEIYLQISKDYNGITYTTVKYLCEHDQLTSNSQFQAFTELYALQVYQVPPTDPVIKSYVIEQLREKRDQLDQASTKERDGELATLGKLRREHEDFMLRKKPEKDK